MSSKSKSNQKKRAHADRLDDNLSKPPSKKARYSYDYHKQQQQQQPQGQHKLPRTATNSDDETVSETDRETLVLPSTVSTPKLPSTLHAAIPKQSQIPHQTMDELLNSPWCAADWFKTRIACNDAEEFIKMLPWDESKSVMQQLMIYRGSALTVIFNLLRTLYTMDKMRRKCKAYSRATANNERNSNKKANLYASSHQKKKAMASKYLKQMNQMLSLKHNNHFGIDIGSEIQKMQQNLRRLHDDIHEYNRLETARKTLYNERDTDSDDEADDDLLILSSNTNQKTASMQSEHDKQSWNTAMEQHHDTEISSCDRESDEDYLGDDHVSSDRRQKKHKKRKRQKKQKKKNSKRRDYDHQEAAVYQQQQDGASYYQPQGEGKNPQQTATDHRKFWSQFRSYFEPIPPEGPAHDAWDSLAPLLHIDAFPVEIPALPNKNNLNVVVDDTLSDAADTLLSSFDHDLTSNTNTNTNTNTNSCNKKQDDDEAALAAKEDAHLYFAEMPKQYEYFHGEKHYVTEQQQLESDEAKKELRRDAIHQDFPQQSLFGHSFDQRVLSCMVHACRGMYDIEAQHASSGSRRVHENNWKEIGDVQFPFNDVSDTTHKRWKKEKAGGYDDGQPFQPVIRYKTVNVSKQEQVNHDEQEKKKITNSNERSNSKRKPFEQTLRDLICKHYFDGDEKAFNKVATKSWNQRTDDEVCATIKSLQNNMQCECNDFAHNGIEQNVKMANQIFDTVNSEIEQHRHYLAWHQFKGHIEHIRQCANRQMTDANYAVTTDTLLIPQFAEHLTKKQPRLPVLEQAVNAVMPSKRVQSSSKSI